MAGVVRDHRTNTRCVGGNGQFHYFHRPYRSSLTTCQTAGETITELTNLPLNIMSNGTSGTSTGRQPVADIPVALWKSIGARADAYCWHINGDGGPYRKSSLAHLLGVSQ
jgi:hypothetical protein